MSLTPSRIDLTCEFIPSILSGSIGFDARVLSSSLRHWAPPRVGFLLRVGFVLRAAVRRPPTRDVDGSHVSCGSVTGASRFLPGLVAHRRLGSCSLRPLTATPNMALASLARTQRGPTVVPLR